MKIIIPVIMVVLFWSCINDKTEEGSMVYKKYDDKGNILFEQSIKIDGKDTIKHGIGKVYFENGLVKYKAFYNNNRRQGKAIEYFDDGTIKNRSYFKDGKKDSLEILSSD
jgi:antitoxin component YwqK of YwqJK toxin-antitoxin module